jgi:hypothetical protein
VKAGVLFASEGGPLNKCMLNYLEINSALRVNAMPLMPGEHLDLTDDPDDAPRSRANKRRFVGVHFVCCDTYARVYINRGQTAYEGHCPKCGKKVRLGIGPDGTDSRFFTAG